MRPLRRHHQFRSLQPGQIPLTQNEMHVQRDSFFRIFSSELRGALQYFFENRRAPHNAGNSQ